MRYNGLVKAVIMGAFGVAIAVGSVGCADAPTDTQRVESVASVPTLRHEPMQYDGLDLDVLRPRYNAPTYPLPDVPERTYTEDNEPATDESESEQARTKAADNEQDRQRMIQTEDGTYVPESYYDRTSKGKTHLDDSGFPHQGPAPGPCEGTDVECEDTSDPIWVEWDDMVEADGTVHTDCEALIGDTTYIRCADGFTETS